MTDTVYLNTVVSQSSRGRWIPVEGCSGMYAAAFKANTFITLSNKVVVMLSSRDPRLHHHLHLHLHLSLSVRSIDQTSPVPNRDAEDQVPGTAFSLHPGPLPGGHT